MKHQTCFSNLLIPAGLFALFIFSGCQKTEGTGGRASIKGTLYALNCYDTATTVVADDAMAAERIYLVYGDNEVYDDNMQTSADGSFEFNYLNEGTYTIFAYSSDTNGGEKAIIREVTLGRKEQLELEPFVIQKMPDDGGGSRIEGRVLARDYNSTFTLLLSEYYLADEYVYLSYGNNVGYATRIKTDYNGYFRFDNLRKGPYRVYVYSKDSTLTIPSGIVPVVNDVYLQSNQQSRVLPQLTVIQ
jgi:hypothetical protein